jgi:CHASE3 domain sensor protein
VMHPRLAADSLVYQQGSTDDDDVLQMVVSRTGRLLVKYVDQRLSRMRSDEQDYMNEQFALAQELLRKGHAALHSSTDTRGQ